MKNKPKFYKQALGWIKKAEPIYDTSFNEDDTSQEISFGPNDTYKIDPQSVFQKEQAPTTLGDIKNQTEHLIFTPMMLMGLNGTGHVSPEEWKIMATAGRKNIRDLKRTVGLREIPRAAAKNYTPMQNAKRVFGRGAQVYFMAPWIANEWASTKYNWGRITDPKRSSMERAAVTGEELMDKWALATELGKVAADVGALGRLSPYAYRLAGLNPMLFGGMALTGTAEAIADHMNENTEDWNNYLQTSQDLDNIYLKNLAKINVDALHADSSPRDESVNPQNRVSQMMNVGPGVILNPKVMEEQVRKGIIPGMYEPRTKYKWSIDTPVNGNPAAGGINWRRTPYVYGGRTDDHAGHFGLVGDSIRYNGAAWRDMTATFNPDRLAKLSEEAGVTPHEYLRRTWFTGTNPSPFVEDNANKHTAYLNLWTDATHVPAPDIPGGLKPNPVDSIVYKTDGLSRMKYTQGMKFNWPPPAISEEQAYNMTPEEAEQLQALHPDKPMFYDPNYAKSWYNPITWGFLTNEATIHQLNDPQQNPYGATFGDQGNQMARPSEKIPPKPRTKEEKERDYERTVRQNAEAGMHSTVPVNVPLRLWGFKDDKGARR